MIISIISIIIFLIIIVVIINFTENKGKRTENPNNQISEEKILEYANNTFEYTEIPEEMKEEYIQEFTSSYKETIEKSEEEIEADMQSLKEVEEVEESQTKADKVAQIVRHKVESNLLIKIEEQETKAQIPNDGYEYTEDGQIGMNSAGYEGLPPEEWEIEAIVIKLHIDYYRLAVGHENELWKCL